jgi:cellulose biosynthesis protein BcsQ
MEKRVKTSAEDSEPEIIDEGIARLLSTASLDEGEYRRFTRQRSQAPASQRKPEPEAAPNSSQRVQESAGRSSGLPASAAPVQPVVSSRERGNSAASQGAVHALRATIRKGGQPDDTGSSFGIGVISPEGGVGVSTIAANLASFLCRMGEEVLLVESANGGDLTHFFGAQEGRPGMRTFVRAGVFPPLRLLTPERGSNEWAPEELARVMQGSSCTCLDLGQVTATFPTALRLCSLVLVPVMPDVRSLRSLEVITQGLKGSWPAETPHPEVLYVLNKLPGQGRFAQNVRTILQQQLGEALFAQAIPFADEVEEAAAVGITLQEYAPESIPAQIFRDIAAWIQARVRQRVSGTGYSHWSER